MVAPASDSLFTGGGGLLVVEGWGRVSSEVLNQLQLLREKLIVIDGNSPV